MMGWDPVLPWKERFPSFCQHLQVFIPGLVDGQGAAQGSRLQEDWKITSG